MRMQLAVQLAPFPQPQVGQETLVAVLHQLAIGLPAGKRLFEPLPDREVSEEIGFFVEKFSVRLRHRLLFVHRTLARILYRERGGNDQHFAQGPLLFRRHQHARNTRIDRQLGELPAGRRNLARLVHRAQFGEQLIAIGNHARRWRIDKRKVLDLAQVQRAHAQNHRSERRT